MANWRHISKGLVETWKYAVMPLDSDLSHMFYLPLIKALEVPEACTDTDTFHAIKFAAGLIDELPFDKDNGNAIKRLTKATVLSIISSLRAHWGRVCHKSHRNTP